MSSPDDELASIRLEGRRLTRRTTIGRTHQRVTKVLTKIRRFGPREQEIFRADWKADDQFNDPRRKDSFERLSPLIKEEE